MRRFGELRATIEELEFGAGEAGRLAGGKIKEVEDEFSGLLSSIDEIVGKAGSQQGGLSSTAALTH